MTLQIALVFTILLGALFTGPALATLSLEVYYRFLPGTGQGK